MKKRLNTENLYLGIFCFYSFFLIIELTLLGVERITQLVKIITILVLAYIYFIKEKTEKRVFLITVFMGVLFLISALTSGRIWLFITFLFIICAENVDFSKILKCSGITSIITIILIFGGSLLGVVNNLRYEHLGIYANCLGFIHYAFPAFILFHVMLNYMTYRKVLTVWEYLVASIACVVFFYVFTSRTTFLLSIVFIIIFAVLTNVKNLNINNKFVRILSIFMPFFLMLIAYICGLMYDNTNKLWRSLNSLVNARLELGKEAFKRYPVNLFGQEIFMQVDIKEEYFFIDSGYVFSLCGYGIIFSLLLMFMFAIMLYDAAETNNKPIFVYILIVLIFSWTNDTLLYIFYNPIVLYFMTALKHQISKEFFGKQ